ncbi:MAG: peroxidase [Acidobacteriota bacterium]
MSFIRMVPEDDATGELADLYAAAMDPGQDRVDNVLKVHSLHPNGLAAHLAIYRAVMAGTKSLRKADRELIAVAVSRWNECHY